MANSEESLAPTPERRRHGHVVLLEETIADADGNPAAPFKSRDAVECLFHRERITKDQRLAAERFREDFRLAHLDAMRAADLTRVSATVYREMIPGFPAERARRRVHAALAALGGHGLLAECAWHVLGEEWSLRRFCHERIGGNPAEAAGVLFAVATLLELHYSGQRAAVGKPAATH